MLEFLLCPCLATASPPAEAGTLRAEVEAVLAGMERAALAGDPAAYLAHVAEKDPRFAMEMRNWANDLAAHTPVYFDLELLDDGAVFEASRARCALLMRFSVPVAADPADRSVVREARFPAVVFDKGADGVWRYAGEDWTVLRGEGFDVCYTGDFAHVAATILEVFPVARGHVDAGFEVQGTGHQTIKLYEDMGHLKATVYLSMPDPYLGGWNEPGESIKFLTRYASTPAAWTRAFAHEYGHVATWEMGPRSGTMPWWVLEGVAELAAEAFDEPDRPGSRQGNDRYIRERAQAGRLVEWPDISDYRTAGQSVKYQAYAQGHHLLGYLSERWGRARRNQWLRRMGAGASLDEATRDALGLGFDELDRRWRQSLAAPEHEDSQ